jgi:hypothetical protein
VSTFQIEWASKKYPRFGGGISAENMFGIWGDDMPPVNSLLDLQVLEFFTGGNVAIREFPVLLFEFASL